MFRSFDSDLDAITTNPMSCRIHEKYFSYLQFLPKELLQTYKSCRNKESLSSEERKVIEDVHRQILQNRSRLSITSAIEVDATLN